MTGVCPKKCENHETCNPFSKRCVLTGKTAHKKMLKRIEDEKKSAESSDDSSSDDDKCKGKVCSEDKHCNPISGKCISKKGKLFEKLMKKAGMEIPSPSPAASAAAAPPSADKCAGKKCDDDRYCNPNTGNCILKTSTTYKNLVKTGKISPLSSSAASAPVSSAPAPAVPAPSASSFGLAFKYNPDDQSSAEKLFNILKEKKSPIYKFLEENHSLYIFYSCCDIHWQKLTYDQKNFDFNIISYLHTVMLEFLIDCINVFKGLGGYEDLLMYQNLVGKYYAFHKLLNLYFKTNNLRLVQHISVFIEMFHKEIILAYSIV